MIMKIHLLSSYLKSRCRITKNIIISLQIILWMLHKEGKYATNHKLTVIWNLQGT